MLTLLKNKLILYGGAILVALLGVIKYLSFTRGIYKSKAKRLDATLKRQNVINEMDTELDKDFKSHKAKIKAEIKEKKSVESLEKPNDF